MNTKFENKSLMKNIISSLILVFLFSHASSQTKRKTHINKTLSNFAAVYQSKSVSALKADYLDKPTLDSCVYLGYDISSESWIAGYKETFEYKQNGTSFLMYSNYWDADVKQWIPESKKEVELDGNGNVILEIDYEYSTGQFLQGEMKEFKYNNNALIIENMKSFYNEGVIINQLRDIYEYDENDYLKLLVTYERNFIDNSWNYWRKLEYKFDIEGNLIEELMTDHDLNGDGIVNYFDWRRTNFLYSTDRYLISIESNIWNEETNDWYVHSKTDYTNNSEGLVLTEKSYVLNDETLEFELRFDDEWVYDLNGNETTYIFRERDETTNEWYIFKEEIFYDLSTFAEEYTMPYNLEFEYLDFQYINKPIGFKYYDFVDSNWELYVDCKFYYSDDVQTSTNNISLPDITITLNSNSISVSWDSNIQYMRLDIYNLSGKKTFSHLVENKQTTTLDFLSNGLYLYKLSNENYTETGKWIITK